ncbi:HIT family hydrolase [Saccharomonospora sp. CUA-673]|uniref:HIT family protein n=1 Tax=Saccharomonospora sp. CUA-673 TaxID=1904969 RepID=UPI00095C7EED|nr:HIT family protein [Saccharomonospora sp. CUA-673]OLT42148.1 HIT family hydrolase [Saccharomonospora sp. CUA-673]
MNEQCVFCGIVAGTAPGVTVAEDDTTQAFMDINPATPGHVLVVPKQHSRDLLDIPADDLSATTRTAQRVARALVDELGADGVNLLNCCGADAWQTVFHFHLHVTPRYRDARDQLTLPWTPGVAADAQELRDVGGRLATALS